MKITKRQLRRIIQETIADMDTAAGWDPSSNVPVGAFGAGDPEEIEDTLHQGAMEFLEELAQEFAKAGTSADAVATAMQRVPGGVPDFIDAVLDEFETTRRSMNLRQPKTSRQQLAELIVTKLGM